MTTCRVILAPKERLTPFDLRTQTKFCVQHRLAAEGAKVALVDKNRNGLDEKVSKMTENGFTAKAALKLMTR